MELFDLFQRLGLALAIGFLVGVERGWQERTREEGTRTAGVRTFALTGLLGGVLAAVSLPDRFIILATGFFVYSAALLLFKWQEAIAEEDRGVTTVIAGMLTFALGAYAVLGQMNLAAAAAVVTTALLASKAVLHDRLRQLTWPELRAGIVLLAMTFVLLPILPNYPIDPWGAFNPYKAWLMTILITCVSFAGYAGVRVLGERQGLEVGSIAGGLISSTMVTLNYARMVAANPDCTPLVANGIKIAGAVMKIRALVIVMMIEPALWRLLAVPLILTGAALGAWAYIVSRRQADADHTLPALAVRNPFDLLTVLKFGALLTAVLVLTRWLQSGLGDLGIYGLAVVSGIVNVDAITLSASQMAGPSLAMEVAAQAILLAIMSNTIAKAVIGWVIGSRTLGVSMLATTLITIALLAAGYFGQRLISGLS